MLIFLLQLLNFKGYLLEGYRRFGYFRMNLRFSLLLGDCMFFFLGYDFILRTGFDALLL